MCYMTMITGEVFNQMLHIPKLQYDAMTRRMFYSKLYCFLKRTLPDEHRSRLSNFNEVMAMWMEVPWVEGATEHDLAVYLTFVWLANFDDVVRKKIRPPREALHSCDEVYVMKCYMVDAGMFDICAFDKS